MEKNIFRTLPTSGVTEVMQKAVAAGFAFDNPEWANLGQGAPEVSQIDGGLDRVANIPNDPLLQMYGPVSGQKAVRQKIADLYNALYRQGSASKYSWENVSICGGGRLALARIVATLGNIRLGKFNPDYTAYSGLFDTFPQIETVTMSREGSVPSPRHIKEHHLDAALISNPCNPTGEVFFGDELKHFVASAREEQYLLIMDECYSNYIYTNTKQKTTFVSAAEYIQDVDIDPVLIIDGVTKTLRYPGWRVCWVLGPKEMIARVDAAGSFLDGGANHPVQSAILPLLEPEKYRQEAQAIQKRFREKRAYMVNRLKNIGLAPTSVPNGAFYVWVDIASLPAPLNTGMAFMEAALRKKVIVIPGEYFDIRSHAEKNKTEKLFSSFIRISYGGDMVTLEKGMDAIESLLSATA
ncbi:MAG: pyridoxal phosphate-dependent aminotransferase [Candidatus Kerfeldbacteria bacterium]|nr:pyridoxal phosphate-dependent aminotransferase [Candidatus Kerfeldbacteria bacterium]